MRGIVLLLLTFVTLSACATSGVHHVVQKGQTLYRIGKTYGVPADKIAVYNHIKDPTQIKVGQSLWIPGAQRTRTVPVVPSKTKPTSTVKKSPTVATAKNKTVVKKSSPKAVTSTKTTVKTVAKKGILDWPVRGKILRSFGVHNGAQSKGIVIAVPEGSAVLSAAAGQVIYSGSGIQGYGHLLIVKHSDNLYTVYGHNRSNLVAAGAFVNKGQKIALSGQVPAFSQGGVHFEVRQGNQAVDPAFFLP